MQTVFCRFAIRGIIYCVLLAIPGWAAAILPAPTTLAHCAVDKTVFDDPFHCALGSGNAIATLALSPFVSLSAQAISPPVDADGAHGSGAMATVTYYFQVLGPPGDIVPILIATSLKAAGTHPSLGIGFATLSIHTTAAGDSVVAVCSNGTCGGGSSFVGMLSTRARSGDLNTISMQVEGSTGSSLTSGNSATASVDPFIFIDPSFAGASLYSIAVSPGVANAAAVPEPASRVLVALGALVLALAAAASRKRRSGLVMAGRAHHAGLRATAPSGI
jgi:hypothetical protein